jgi:hypothetical protein
MKICSKCKLKKLLECFAIKNSKKNLYSSECKECHKSYGQNWYARNKQKHKRNTDKNRKATRQQIKKIIISAKSVPCKDCKKTYAHYVMDFDHLPQFKKFLDVSTMVSHGYCADTILREIAKCEVVCANCHRERTHGAHGGNRTPIHRLEGECPIL